MLVAAVHEGSVEGVRAALQAGASVDERDTVGHTALMLACQSGRIELVEALLAAGASPNRRTTEREETALHQLARRADGGEVLAALLTHRVRIDRPDRFGWTPLMVAAHNGLVGNVDRLLAAGADATAQAPDGRTAAELARAAGHTAAAERLGQ